MLKICDDNTIRLTRGDDCELEIVIQNSITHSIFNISAGDILTFTAKKNLRSTSPSFQKNVTGTNYIPITSSDTKDLSFGLYYYDVQLTTSDGSIYTVLFGKLFIEAEVTL